MPLILLVAVWVVLGIRLNGLPAGTTDVSDRHWWIWGIASGHTSYLWHHVLTLVPVILLSFEHRIRYVEKWPSVFQALFLPAALYIAWDILFTDLGVWSFDHDKVTGPFLAGLPWEEWLWFAAVPFACIFIYENLLYYLPEDPWKGIDRWFSPVFIVIMFGLAVISIGQVYSFLAFSSAGLVTLWDYVFREAEGRSRFYMTFAISLVPMLFFNGWLTGMLSDSPLVSYHPEAFFGLRLGTMPVEDIFFGYGYLFLIVRSYQQIVHKHASRGT